MSTIRSFEELHAWKFARSLNREIYRITAQGPFSRDFALRDQIRRASISVSSNIAEGFERNGNREFINFLSMAKASAGEVRSQLCLALDLGYLDEPTYKKICSLITQTSRTIWGMMEYLKTSTIPGAKYKLD